ncbi:MAG TPA: hypothetical protein VGM64_16840 [Lacunisphaera sp.]|jgi:hypothetical protein
MQLDIRFPMGLLFIVLGTILTVYGLISDASIYVQHSLGHNVNIFWGVIFLLFGGIMVWLSRRRA